MASFTAGLSLQDLAKEIAKFMGIFSGIFFTVNVEIKDLLHTNVIVCEDKSLVHKIFFHVRRSMYGVPERGKWDLTLCIHEVRRLKDEVFISKHKKSGEYVAITITAKSHKGSIVERFLRVSCRHLEIREDVSISYPPFFPCMDFVNFYDEEGVAINAELGLILTIYFPKI